MAAPITLYKQLGPRAFDVLEPVWGTMLHREPASLAHAHEHYRELSTPPTPGRRLARINELVKAGALIAAEIDRLERISDRPTGAYR